VPARPRQPIEACRYVGFDGRPSNIGTSAGCSRLVGVIRALLAAAVVALVACESFEAPRLPDLYKSPYDFAVELPPYTGPGADMTPELDLGKSD
jgi:hypothetical protein